MIEKLGRHVPSVELFETNIDEETALRWCWIEPCILASQDEELFLMKDRLARTRYTGPMLTTLALAVLTRTSSRNERHHSMRLLAIVLVLSALGCKSQPSKGELYAYRAGIADAIAAKPPITPALPAEVNANVEANLVEVFTKDADVCGNIYTRIGLAKLRTPKGVYVTCGVEGQPSAWRLRERDGELWEAKD